MAQDWFRKRTWTEGDERDFRARLSRARKESRPQYLRIQAGSLAGSGPDYLAASIRLLEEMLNDYPQSLEVAVALAQKAQCLMELGDVEHAVECYAASVSRMRAVPKMQTQDGWLDYGLLVATERLSSRYDEALNLLAEFAAASPLMLPVDWFKVYTARALIFSELGEADRAAAEARLALDMSEQTQSGLQYHPHVGVVGARYAPLRARLEKLSIPNSETAPKEGRNSLRGALKRLFTRKR